MTELGVDEDTVSLGGSVLSSVLSSLAGSLTIWQSPTVMIWVSTPTAGTFSSGSTRGPSSSSGGWRCGLLGEILRCYRIVLWSFCQILSQVHLIYW